MSNVVVNLSKQYMTWSSCRCAHTSLSEHVGDESCSHRQHNKHWHTLWL